MNIVRITSVKVNLIENIIGITIKMVILTIQCCQSERTNNPPELCNIFIACLCPKALRKSYPVQRYILGKLFIATPFSLEQGVDICMFSLE